MITVTATMDISDVFKPLGFVFQAFGMYVPSCRTGCRKYLQWAYCVFIQIACWFNVTRFLFVLMFVLARSLASALHAVALFILYLANAFLCSSTLSSMSKNMDSFVIELSSYKTKYGFKSNLRKRRICMLTVCVAIVAYSLTTPILDVFPIPVSWLSSDTVEYTKIPFNMLKGTPYYCGLAYLYIIAVIQVMIQSIPWVLFSTCCGLLKSEFNRINTCIKKMVFNEGSNTDWEKIRIQHTSICRALQKCNNIITHFLFANYASQIPAVCFLLYGIITRSLSSGELKSALTNAASGVFYCFYSTFAAAALNSAAHGCLDDLTQVDLSRLSSTQYHTVSLFVARLTNPPIGFTVYSLFTIDGSTILMIFGTLVTYALLVLQFNIQALNIGPSSPQGNVTAQ